MAKIFLAGGLLLICCHGSATEFYASPNGSSSGDGSIKQPWNLRTALNSSGVMAGDTIWLRGGIYRESNRVTKFLSTLQGTSNQPVIVRQFPGERATIDGNIMQTEGGFVNYWGFEIMNSHPNRQAGEVGPFPEAFRLDYDGVITDLAVSGFDLRAPGVKLINLVIHDSIGGGIGVNINAVDAEIYGNLCYYNGWQGCDRGHGHGIYAQNVDPSVVKIEENIFHGNYALGAQFTGSESLSDNFHLEGNVIFLNGAIAREHQANFLLGSFVGESRDPVLIRNFFYDTQGSTDSDANIGYSGGASGAIIVSNYFQTSVHFSEANNLLTVERNSFLSNTVHLNTNDFPDNFFLANAPRTNLVEVRTNKYEAGRANIVIYNWEGRTNIAVDVSACLQPGMDFEVRNAQDFFGRPVLRGTYGGGVLNLPMTGLAVAKPIGANPAPSMGPEFGMFLLLPVPPVGPEVLANTAPSVSFIDDQTTQQNVATAPGAFTVSDAETPAEYLNVSVRSSDIALIPNPNINFSGTSFDRTISLLPKTNEVGTSIITLTVSDGFLAASTSFSVTVNTGVYRAPEASNTNTQTGKMSVRVENDGSVFLQFRGNPGDRYTLQGSDDFIGWSEVVTRVTDCEGLIQFVDVNASQYSARFYRMALMPPPGWAP